MTGNKKVKSNSVESTTSKQLRDLEAENELLLMQLRQVQEELSIYFSKCKALEKTSKDFTNLPMSSTSNVSNEVIKALSEIPRLSKLIESQQWQQSIVLENSLKAKLGELLIQSVSSVSKFIMLPFSLVKIWYAAKSRYIPDYLGSDKFEKVIEEFQKGGFDATERLLAPVTSIEVKGRAYTSLARHLMQAKQLSRAAEAARRAYCVDPQPYRLKWLAFRLFEAGEAIEAEAIISLLPNDVPFSDSEARHREQLIKESNRRRINENKRLYGLHFQPKEANSQSKIEIKDKQIEIDSNHQAEIRNLKLAFDESQNKVSVLSELHQKLQKQIDDQTKIIESQKKKNVMLEKDNIKLVKQYEANKKIIFDQSKSVEQFDALTLQVESQLTEIELLKRNISRFEQDKNLMVEEQKRLEEKSSEYLKTIMIQKMQISQLELDKQILAEERVNFERVNTEQISVIESLKQSISLLKSQINTHNKK